MGSNIARLTATACLALLAATSLPIQAEEAPTHYLKRPELIEKFEQNGEKLMCEQKPYQRCFSLSESKCKRQAKRYKKRCLKVAQEEVPSVDSREDSKAMVTSYSTCMAKRQLVAAPAFDMPEIASCLKRTDFDDQAIRNSLIGK